VSLDDHALPIHVPPDGTLRDRVDLSFRRDGTCTTLGLFDLAGEDLLDIHPCPAQTPALQQWLDWVRDHPPPVDRASLRLRVGPGGRRGIWLDTANVGIRDLLEERSWLELVSAESVVELGQRRKRAEWDGQRWKLGRPTVEPWFETPLRTSGRMATLHTAVGAFTQPSMLANRCLVDRVRHQVLQTRQTTWLEYGAGAGNLTLPLADAGCRVVATETDPVARDGLRLALQQEGLADRVVVSTLNLGRNTAASRALFVANQGLLVDPPRSGLGAALDTLAAAAHRPTDVVYVSCFGDTLMRDIGRLVALGYRLVDLEGVDQFPDTPHGEWVGRLVHEG
jgi:23S rRNA (uracil1939-C5)-methyltransferase